MAPELIPRLDLEESALDNFVPKFSQESDVYAFGLVGLEVQSFFLPPIPGYGLIDSSLDFDRERTFLQNQ